MNGCKTREAWPVSILPFQRLNPAEIAHEQVSDEVYPTKAVTVSGWPAGAILFPPEKILLFHKHSSKSVGPYQVRRQHAEQNPNAHPDKYEPTILSNLFEQQANRSLDLICHD